MDFLWTLGEGLTPYGNFMTIRADLRGYGGHSTLIKLMILTGLNRYRDFGLLLLRVGVGLVMILHGWPKVVGGPKTWTMIGGAMQHLGIHFYPVLWGFLAAMSETLGGAFLLLGFLFRPATASLFFTMVVATTFLIKTQGAAFNAWSEPVSMGIVFLGLFFIGAGRYSIDRA